MIDFHNEHQAKFTARWSGTSRRPTTPTSERRGPRRTKWRSKWDDLGRILTLPQSMVYANERGRALPRSPSEELRRRRGGVGGRCVAHAAAGPEWREGQRHKERCTARESPPSLPPFHLPRSAARSSFVWTDRAPRGDGGERREGRFIVDRSNSDRFFLVVARARSASGARALHFTACARLFSSSYFTVATSTVGVAA